MALTALDRVDRVHTDGVAPARAARHQTVLDRRAQIDHQPVLVEHAARAAAQPQRFARAVRQQYQRSGDRQIIAGGEIGVEPHLCNRQRQQTRIVLWHERAGLVQGEGVGCVEGCDRCPVVAVVFKLRERAGAGGQPAGLRAERALAVVVGVGHRTRALAAGDQPAVAFDQVVVVEEQGVVAQLVRQGARPLLAQLGRGFAVAVPDRAHAQLARLVDQLGVGRVGASVLDNPALGRAGAHAVGGVQPDVGRVPVLAVVEDMDVAQRGLAAAPAEQQLRGALDLLVQLGAEARVAPRIPLDRKIQVEQDQRQLLRDGERLDAGQCDGPEGQTVWRGPCAGVVERVGSGGADRRERDQPVGQGERLVALEVAAWVGVPLRVSVGRRWNELALGDLLVGQTVDPRVGSPLALGVDHAHLCAAQVEGG